MTFADANYFLRYIVRSPTADGQAKAEQAAVLFRAVERGEAEMTTSEAVIAEVAYVLAGPRHYHLPAAEVATRLRPLLLLGGFRLPRKRLYLRALDIMVEYPRLGFVDALTVATLEQSGLALASFDADFDRIPGIARYRP